MKKVNFKEVIRKLCLKIANDNCMQDYVGSELFWIDDYVSGQSMHVDGLVPVYEGDDIVDIEFLEDGSIMKLSKLSISCLNDVYEFLCDWYNTV